MLFPVFPHCLQLQLMDLEQGVPLIAAFHQHRVSSSKQSKCCHAQTLSWHPEMELWGELAHWEVDLSNYVTVDWPTGYTSSCPQYN